MDISEISPGRPSYVPELTKKLEEGAPLRELQRLIALEMASILGEREELIDALAPNQINLRAKETRRYLNYLKHLFMGVRIFGKYVNETHKRRDSIDWEGQKFGYVLKQLVDLAVDSLRKTGQTEHATQHWVRHYCQQLEERLKGICQAADNL